MGLADLLLCFCGAAYVPRVVSPGSKDQSAWNQPNTGGYEPPFFRERGAFPLCSGNANPLRFPPQRKGGSPKISAFPEKRGNGPKVGLVPGMTKPPTPQKCPFPLRVPTFVPGLLRPRFCSPFWFPLPFLVSLGAVCSGFRSPNEKTHNFGAPRGGYRKKPLSSLWTVLWVVRMMNKIIWIRSGTIYFWALKRRTRTA